jgi:hypothetical protein
LIVQVHPDASISLDDPDTFSAFAVRAGSRSLAQIVAAFGPDASAGEDDHIWIALSRLYELGEVYGGPDWRAGCDGMIKFATSKGWVDEQRGRVRAHVER